MHMLNVNKTRFLVIDPNVTGTIAVNERFNCLEVLSNNGKLRHKELKKSKI